MAYRYTAVGFVLENIAQLMFAHLNLGVANRLVIIYIVYLCTPEPGRPGCVISIQKFVNGDAYPVVFSQKVTKNLPVSFYSPTPGFNKEKEISHIRILDLLEVFTQ